MLSAMSLVRWAITWLGIEDLDVVVDLDVAGGDDARALLAERQRGLVAGRACGWRRP